ncbi:hypothetical protein [Vibrio paracholerae]|uniref:hypothetical protein n=1 Tax=Vibrio paracholerae TaxID=650003 RepID=UPI0035BBBCF4
MLKRETTNHDVIVFIANFSYHNNGLNSLDHELYSGQVNRWCYPLDAGKLRSSEQTLRKSKSQDDNP